MKFATTANKLPTLGSHSLRQAFARLSPLRWLRWDYERGQLFIYPFKGTNEHDTTA